MSAVSRVQIIKGNRASTLLAKNNALGKGIKALAEKASDNKSYSDKEKQRKR